MSNTVLSFNERELTLLSDSILTMIDNAGQAKRLVCDTTSQKNKLFEYIDNGLNISHLRESPTMRKWLNDNKDRIRMFACIYQIMKTGAVFYVENGKLSGTDRIDYIKSKSISGKGVHLGMRYEEGV